MSTINISEMLQRELNGFPSVYYPEVLGFIESLKTDRPPAIPATVFLSNNTATILFINGLTFLFITSLSNLKRLRKKFEGVDHETLGHYAGKVFGKT